MDEIKMEMVKVKMMMTVYGDIWCAKNAYWGIDRKWHFEGWETIPHRQPVPEEWIKRDTVLWETEIPTMFFEKLFRLEF